MHIEIQERGGRKHYYLAHSYRKDGKVRKVRRYLGPDLTKTQVKQLRAHAEKSLKAEIESRRKIRDPLKTVLTPGEVKEINALIMGGDVNISRLSEGDWLHFTELFTYDTNAIEGSTVTAKEVRKILEEDEWPKERGKWEIAETYGLAEAVAYIRETRTHVSINLVKRLHELCFANSKTFSGKLREKGVEVVIADIHGNVVHRGAPQKKIVNLLKELIEWYKKNKKKYHPIVLAAVVHNQFENIHPFQDGNGRVGRLLLNNILLKHGMPPVNIELKNRREYYASLQAYEREGDLRPTIELMLKEYKRLQKQLKNM